MKKRLSLSVILILILGVILALSLVSCNKPVDTGKLPPIINDNPDTTVTNVTSSLKFTFPKEPSSFLWSIDVEKFNVEEYVEYTIVHTDEKRNVIDEVPKGRVTETMIAEADVPKLKQAGHHVINVTAYDDSQKKEVKGAFSLYLKSSSKRVLVDYTFDLNDKNGGGVARAYFGMTRDGKATISVEQGSVITSFSDFVNAFRMKLDGKAVEKVYAKNSDKWITESDNFNFTVEGAEEFEVYWTDDVVRVTYDLNVPKEAVLKSTAQNPEDLFKAGGEYADVYVRKTTGKVPEPAESLVNVYNGYYFAGWFKKGTDDIWWFTKPVGTEKVELYAKWVIADYSFTLYTMGGTFKMNLQPSRHKNEDGTFTPITESNYQDLGYTLIDSTSRFTVDTGALNMLTFTGFRYGTKFEKYVSKVTINAAGETMMLKFSEVYDPKHADDQVLVRGGDFFKIDELYNNYQCDDIMVRDEQENFNAEHPVAYLKWVLDETASDAISRQYQALFGNNIELKADGTLKIGTIKDYTINELKVPATLTYGGVQCQVSEIADRALYNTTSLTLLDLSEAKYLTRIGKEAFALDSNLTNVIMPKECAIKEIGDYAFNSTKFENNFAANNGGAEFIVVGNMIYRYVGENKPSIDLSDPEHYYTSEKFGDMTSEQLARFNDELKNVTILNEGAFSSCTNLSEIKISPSITTISASAFSGLANFKNLVLPSENVGFTDISEDAFEGSGFLSEGSNLYDAGSKSIIIGNVYYRLLDKTATEVTVPKTYKNYEVTVIAPKAFTGCTSLASVKFEDETNITAVGKDALIDTKYIQGTGKYTVINGILAVYYNPTQDNARNNLIVPENVTKIASNAFGNYAQYFKTVQINSNVKRIDDYAFARSANLVSVIFADGIADKNNHKLLNLPDIGDYAFATEDGKILNGVNFFFSKSAIDYLAKLSGDATERAAVTDEITLQWLQFYETNKSVCKTEEITSVTVDSSKVPDVLMLINPKKNAYTDKFGEDTILDALIVNSNTLIPRTANLDLVTNNVNLIKVTSFGDYKDYYDENHNYYVLTFIYNNDKEHVWKYRIEVFTAIDVPENEGKGENEAKDYLKFTSSDIYGGTGNPINVNGKNSENSRFWVEGLDSQKMENGKPVFGADNSPIFFLNNLDLSKIVFKYKPISGDVITMPASNVRVQNLNVDGVTQNARTAHIIVDFYGLGTYDFEFKYNVVKPKFTDILQNAAISLPINANPVNYLKNFGVDIKGEDGKATYFPLSDTRLSVSNIIGPSGLSYDTLDTKELGTYSATLQFSDADSDSFVSATIYYNVVLTADENMFNFEIHNTGNSDVLTAKITSIKSAYRDTAETIIVPSTWTVEDGVDAEGNPKYKVYTVVQLGTDNDTNGVFAGMTSLEAVYIPNTITTICANTFDGCSNLTNIYTSLPVQKNVTKIITDDIHFELYEGESSVEINNEKWTVKNAKLISLENVTYGENLIIGEEYRDETNKVIYKVVDIKEGLLNGNGKPLDVFVPDTVIRKVVLVNDDTTAIQPELHIYSVKSDFLFTTASHLPSGLRKIGNTAFRFCYSLTSLDFSKVTELDMLGTNAFQGSGIVEIDLSKCTKLIEIQSYTFQMCDSLRRVILPNSVIALMERAFVRCSSLESVTGLENLIYIGDRAFNACTNLTDVELFDKLTNVGYQIFSGCTAVTVRCHFGEDKLNQSTWDANWVESTRPIVFNCDSNEKANDGYVYILVDGLRYALETTADGRKIAILAGQKSDLSGAKLGDDRTSFEIAVRTDVTYKGENYKVVKIGAGAFKGNTDITKVYLGSAVLSENVEMEIDQEAFADCSNLLEVELTKVTLTRVHNTAFNNCDKLTNVPSVTNDQNN